MIDIKRNQNNCDHVFSFTTQDGVHIFKCESCVVKHQFVGNDKVEENCTIDLP